jgi:RNA polymerase sigma-70 factor (ECF subfamily)
VEQCLREFGNEARVKLSQAEFEKLAMEQMDMLYRTARRFTRDSDRAGDLVQETFLRALRGRATFDLQAHGIRPWLVRIMRNLHLSRAERESRQPRAIETESLDTWSAPADGNASSRDIFQNMDEELVRALQELPEDYQAVLLLWAVEDFSYKEIAHAVEAPIGTVMSRLHRARQRLLESLKDFGDERRMIRE